jgi:hypothetical protein
MPSAADLDAEFDPLHGVIISIMRWRWILALVALTIAPNGRSQMRTGGAHKGSGVVMSRGAVFAGSRHSGVRFQPGFRGQFFFNRRFHHRRFSFAATPWSYYGYPGYYYADYSYAPDAYGSYDRSSAYYELSRDLAAELDRLSDEVERLREEQQETSSPRVPTERERLSHPQGAEKPDPGEPTILVFQDQHRQDVHNYAIVGQTLWIFTEQRARKVPVSDLDLEATRNANEEHGVEFRVPK